MKLRKLILFPVAGAAVALVAGFAAPLAINSASGAPIQVGTTAPGSLSCADSATVTAWLYNDQNGKVDGARVQLNDADNSCGVTPGRLLYVTPLDVNENPLSQAGHAHIGSVVSGEYLVLFGMSGANPNTPVSAVALEGVRIGIDQGYPHTGH